MRILWIEDQDSQIKYHRFLLKKRGHSVTVCSNGEDGLEAILSAQKEGQPYDMVLLDIMLPKGVGAAIDASTRTELMGEGLLREMKRHGIAIPVLCVTAIADAALTRRLMAYPFVIEVKKKPVRVLELEDALSSVPAASPAGQE